MPKINIQREIEGRSSSRLRAAADGRRCSEIVAALRISNDLETHRDLAKNIAKRVSVLEDEIRPPSDARCRPH